MTWGKIWTLGLANGVHFVPLKVPACMKNTASCALKGNGTPLLLRYVYEIVLSPPHDIWRKATLHNFP